MSNLACTTFGLVTCFTNLACTCLTLACTTFGLVTCLTNLACTCLTVACTTLGLPSIVWPVAQILVHLVANKFPTFSPLSRNQKQFLHYCPCCRIIPHWRRASSSQNGVHVRRNESNWIPSLRLNLLRYHRFWVVVRLWTSWRALTGKAISRSTCTCRDSEMGLCVFCTMSIYLWLAFDVDVVCRFRTCVQGHLCLYWSFCIEGQGAGIVGKLHLVW